jgi:hypothetical protein
LYDFKDKRQKYKDKRKKEKGKRKKEKGEWIKDKGIGKKSAPFIKIPDFGIPWV